MTLFAASVFGAAVFRGPVFTARFAVIGISLRRSSPHNFATHSFKAVTSMPAFFQRATARLSSTLSDSKQLSSSHSTSRAPSADDGPSGG